MSCRCQSSILGACEYLLFKCRKSLTKCVKETDLRKYKAVPLFGWGFFLGGGGQVRGVGRVSFLTSISLWYQPCLRRQKLESRREVSRRECEAFEAEGAGWLLPLSRCLSIGGLTRAKPFPAAWSWCEEASGVVSPGVPLQPARLNWAHKNNPESTEGLCPRIFCFVGWILSFESKPLGKE